MYLTKIETPEGAYTDALGNRYDVCGARRVRTAQASGCSYETFPSLEAALAKWSLQLEESVADAASTIPHKPEASPPIDLQVLSGDEPGLG